MRILPPVLRPWPREIRRRHRPSAARGRYGYRKYRQCLRWEFGFTCAFCQCHETDLRLHGVEGTGLTQIEHFIPVSHAGAGTNDYTNCFYICCFCNSARGVAPSRDPQRSVRLLNPCESIWGQLFDFEDDRLEPHSDDPNAAYTCDVYALNDPRKTWMRRQRRTIVRDRLSFLKRGQKARDRLLEQASQTPNPGLVDAAMVIEEALKQARRDMELFVAIPSDARASCSCREDKLCQLPSVLTEQTIEAIIPPPPWRHRT